MSLPVQYVPAACSLTAMSVWGVSDFVGGVGSRRVHPFLFTAIAHFSAMVVLGSIAFLTHAPLPRGAGIQWALLAGAIGGFSLALFYQALATGKMGLTAPVAALLGAAIPTIVTAFRVGDRKSTRLN